MSREQQNGIRETVKAFIARASNVAQLDEQVSSIRCLPCS
jgi:hypothetical protein